MKRQTFRCISAESTGRLSENTLCSQAWKAQHRIIGQRSSHLKIVDLEDRPLGPWKQSSSLTADGNLVIVDTSGHVPRHTSLVIYSRGKDDEKQATYLLPGCGLDLLNKEEPNGINDDPMRALKSLQAMKQFARETEVVILPSYDPSTPQLLAERVIYRPSDI